MDINNFVYMLGNACVYFFIRNKRDLIIVAFCSLMYILNENFFKQSNIYFFKNFFNDLLAMPILLAYVNIIFCCIKNKRLSLMRNYVILLIVACVFWEFCAPYLKKTSVSDYRDCFCYIVGTAIYYCCELHYQRR